MHLSRPRPALLPKDFRFISYLRPGDGERSKVRMCAPAYRAYCCSGRAILIFVALQM